MAHRREPRTGQWFVSRDGTRWWFDSGSLALDFAYTGSMGRQLADWETWHGPPDLAAWLEDRFGMPVDATARDLRRAKELRDAVAGLAESQAYGRAVSAGWRDTVDRYAARPDVPPQLGSALPPAMSQLLSAVARDAVLGLLAEPERIRCCSGERCAVVYLDTSRSRNRRWCSMTRCGNRDKVRRQRARQHDDPDR